MRISDWSSDVCSSDLQQIMAKMHWQRPRSAFGPKASHLIGFPIDADADVFIRFELDPRATRANRHGLAPGGQIDLWHDKQVEQAIIDQRVRAKRNAAAGLAAIPNGQCQKHPLPSKALSPKTTPA